MIVCDDICQLAAICAELFKNGIKFTADASNLQITLQGY